jgi:outer membrane protein TolC
LNSYSQQTNGKLSLNACIQIALDRNTEVQTYRNLRQMSKLGVNQAYSNILPVVNTTFSTGKYQVGDATFLGDAVDPVTGQVKQITLTREGFSRTSHRANLSVNQNLFDGGFWWNNIKQRKVEKTTADFNLQVTENQVITLVAQYYFDLLKQQKLLEVYSIAVQRSEDQLNRAQQMYEIGSVALVDVYRAKVNYGQDKISFLNQENIVLQAKQQLNLAMGRDALEPIEIEGEYDFEHQIPNLEDLLNSAKKYQPALRSRE